MLNWNEVITKLLKKAGVKGQIMLSTPPKPEMGDFAFPCFNLAKEAQINPAEAAKELAAQIAPANGIIKIAAFGPYVNFFVDSNALIEQVVGGVLHEKEKYGLGNAGKGRQILIEYPSNNTHKEFHIGHFRNVCIGNTLVGLYRTSGYKVHVVNYLNDFGSHVAKCLWGLMKFHADEAAPEN